MARQGADVKLCKTDGCVNPSPRSSYCEDCRDQIRFCRIDGCPAMLSAHNKSGYCYDHRYIAMKEKLLRRVGG